VLSTGGMPLEVLVHEKSWPLTLFLFTFVIRPVIFSHDAIYRGSSRSSSAQSLVNSFDLSWMFRTSLYV
jgi:hypothetical protein